MEELQNQPEIPPKRMKLQEIDNMADDRISAFPDCLLLEILSRLDCTKSAIKTGTLSKRWKHQWTSLPNLNFGDCDCCNQRWPAFVSSIDKTLAQRGQLKLKKFYLFSGKYKWGSGSQVDSWIRYAIRCNVEVLILLLFNKQEDVADFPQDQIFFSTSCFTELRLTSCMVNPTGPISWENLKSLSLSEVRLDEDLIENILSGSPVLESLVLYECYGHRRLNITSTSVKNFVLSQSLHYTVSVEEFINDDPKLTNIIEINAPNILSLEMGGDIFLRMVVLVNVSSLVEAKLYYMTKLSHDESAYQEEEEKMLKRFILNLRHVKKLSFSADDCSEVLARLEAKGFVIPSNISFMYDLSCMIDCFVYGAS